MKRMTPEADDAIRNAITEVLLPAIENEQFRLLNERQEDSSTSDKKNALSALEAVLLIFPERIVNACRVFYGVNLEAIAQQRTVASFIEKYTDKLVTVILSGKNIRVEGNYNSSLPNKDVKEHTLELPLEHLCLLQMMLDHQSETLDFSQVIELGLASNEKGVTQMLHSINKELRKNRIKLQVYFLPNKCFQLALMENRGVKYGELSGSDFSPFVLMADGIYQEYGTKLLEELSPREVEVFLCLLDNFGQPLTVDEIALYTNVPLGTARSVLGTLTLRLDNYEIRRHFIFVKIPQFSGRKTGYIFRSRRVSQEPVVDSQIGKGMP